MLPPTARRRPGPPPALGDAADTALGVAARPFPPGTPRTGGGRQRRSASCLGRLPRSEPAFDGACDTRWRKLGCFKQALLALIHLRENETFSQPEPGSGVSQATTWRYVDESLNVLVSWMPGLHEALIGLGEGDYVTVDGALIPSERVAASMA